MLLALSRRPKLIAGCLAGLFYLDLIVAPVAAHAESRFVPAAAGGQSIARQASVPPASAVTAAPPATTPITFPGDAKHKPVASVFAQAQPDQGFTTGPTQPEMAAFTSVNASNMVDLFTGDFSYNIPLLDVGGYPVNLAYRGGISMDQEASWVGLGWNINPGTITRNMRGLPDDFNGAVDSIRKTMSIRENKTIGVTAGADIEIAGFPESESTKKIDTVYTGFGLGTSLGVFHNTYRGWGVEHGLNASINSGASAKGPLSGGLSITNNSQEGFTMAPSLSLQLGQLDQQDKSGSTGSFSIGLPYNSRSGLKGLQISAGVRQYALDEKNQRHSYGGSFSSMISFASPAFTPGINMPYTSRQFSFTGKVGFEKKVYHPSFYLSGYVSKQFIARADTLLALPAYGYLHFSSGAQNKGALLDFNREKEIPYRENPPVPHIAVPFYTYDAFSITGEGTGGMFRAYRGDIGFVFDHYIRTKDESDRLSVDVGIGDIVHAGVDLNINRAFTQSGPWLTNNTLKQMLDFRKDSGLFESVYFRNPGEKAINSKAFYEAIGGDDVVTVQLAQAGRSSATNTTNYLTRYRNKRKAGTVLLDSSNTIKPERDKRAQVISYVTAKEADAGAALSKYIENYTPNEFSAVICGDAPSSDIIGNGIGLPALYFPQTDFKGTPISYIDPGIPYSYEREFEWPFLPNIPHNWFSVKWIGRVRAPETGKYTFYVRSDDGVRLWLNDSLLINDYIIQAADTAHTAEVNLIAGEVYDIRIDYFQGKGPRAISLEWEYGENPREFVPYTVLYPRSVVDSFKINDYLIKEKRVNRFRKENHISEITVLNPDGRRYVYGIPVYNLKQKETTFSVNAANGDAANGTVSYQHGVDNTANNQQGKDWYYNSEEIPAYAHSFLLTGIVSADYSDVTGNGISDDDIGDAVKFNYSKICGINNPYRWRAPGIANQATYNEGLKTDRRDDKGSYVYGEKELWYLHSIVSKTMIATFELEEREDLPAVAENGVKYNESTARRLKAINLYSKAEFMKKGTDATPIKTVHFEYDYELCPGVNGVGTGKLTLKKVWFTYNGNDKGKLNPYVFSYNSKNPSYNINLYDRWGNYKDPQENPGSTENNVITNAEYPYALQDSTLAAQNAAAWMLDSVFLPSGGSIKVTYESDDYAYVQNKRAMQLFKIAGLGTSPGDAYLPGLYENAGSGLSDEHLYVFVKVPEAVTSAEDVYYKYLSGISKLYFKLFVRMPSDQFGSGYEYVSCYADLAATESYGVADTNTVWLRLAGVSLKGDQPGDFSPLAKAAIQFLRLNLPSKAYPGSENAGSLDLREAVEMVASLGANIQNAFRSFDRIARQKGWAALIDTSRSFVRLNNPEYKKYGGGYRVKKVVVYDNWDKMTNQRAATYGQEYIYTTSQEINGEEKIISSGVAVWEPGLGGEENPFRVPIEYVEKIAPLGPVTLGYTEEPLGESFFPSPGVGYSCVRTRTIHYKNRKSANGYEETKFYTAYDFPVYTDRSLIDGDTKKRYKPGLANFLRVNARHHLVLSQGFKIELNDMHGKLRSKASYAETDQKNPISYSENIYRVENPQAIHKRLSNTAMAIRPDGTIDTTALIGKDVELMVDMREQLSITNGYNVNLNTELFTVPFLPPFFVLPTALNLAQREENIFRSAATVKIIHRYGIMDSVIAIDKGSKVSTKDILYDSETGDVLLTRTQNEFNDYVYNFSYPSHWAYDGMGLAYQNINLTLKHVDIRDGKIVSPMPAPDSVWFSSGDEILVAGKQKTGDGTTCQDEYSTWPLYNKIWAIDSSIVNGGPKSFYFIDRNGQPYGGYDITMKVIRSGRRNIFGSVGSVTSLESPLKRNAETGQYELALDTTSKVIAAGTASFRQLWQVENIKYLKRDMAIFDEACPEGYTYSELFNACIRDTAVVITDSFKVCASSRDNSYSSCGTYIYYDFNVTNTQFVRSKFFNPADTLWVQHGSEHYCEDEPATEAFGGEQESMLQSIHQLIGDTSKNNGQSFGILQFPSSGPLNRTGVWTCNPGSVPAYTWYGFTIPVFIPHDGTYYLGMAADNLIRVTIDTSLFREDTNPANYETFKLWHIFPVYLTRGIHNFTIEGQDDGLVATGFGLEIYDNTEHELRAARSYNDLNLLFSTKDIIDKWLPSAYSCPTGYILAGDTSEFFCRSILPRPQDTIISESCESIVADTAFNPYITGVLGNWRADRSYVYYSSRTETDPTTLLTDIRRYGTIRDFAPYWTFADNRLTAQPDTNLWVWNSESTLFNRKGFEMENKDPLGRYNSVVYGYNLTLPVAVTQNSRNRESAFEGFEDYDFVTQICDTACSPARHIDFRQYVAKIDTTEKHTGTSSLRLNASEQATLSFDVSTNEQDTLPSKLTFNLLNNACSPDGRVLEDIRTDNNILLPSFSPMRTTKMVLSAWVKEDQDCKCVSYTNNRIVVAFPGSSSGGYIFTPTGAIIEGWQRYESVFEIPADANGITVALEANGSATVFFDDLRLHPYNANMKSFVFHPANLRLMAELDENNYATFYEYDDDGTLIRLKKETERGVKMIRETRSALTKQ